METMIVVTGVESPPRSTGSPEAEREKAAKQVGEDIDYVE